MCHLVITHGYMKFWASWGNHWSLFQQHYNLCL